MAKIIKCKSIKIKGNLPRNEIVRKVVNTFIKTEYQKKGKGVTFLYPVEKLPGNIHLFIASPGHKKNFDFKVEVTEEMGLKEGKHDQVVLDLRVKKQCNPQEFKDFLRAVEEVYHCSENDIDRLLSRYPNLKGARDAYQSFMKAYLPDAGGKDRSKTEDGKWTFARQRNEFVLVVFGAPKEADAETLIKATEEKLPGGR